MPIMVPLEAGTKVCLKNLPVGMFCIFYKRPCDEAAYFSSYPYRVKVPFCFNRMAFCGAWELGVSSR